MAFAEHTCKGYCLLVIDGSAHLSVLNSFMADFRLFLCKAFLHGSEHTGSDVLTSLWLLVFFIVVS